MLDSNLKSKVVTKLTLKKKQKTVIMTDTDYSVQRSIRSLINRNVSW